MTCRHYTLLSRQVGLMYSFYQVTSYINFALHKRVCLKSALPCVDNLTTSLFSIQTLHEHLSGALDAPRNPGRRIKACACYRLTMLNICFTYAELGYLRVERRQRSFMMLNVFPRPAALFYIQPHQLSRTNEFLHGLGTNIDEVLSQRYPQKCCFPDICKITGINLLALLCP